MRIKTLLQVKDTLERILHKPNVDEKHIKVYEGKLRHLDELLSRESKYHLKGNSFPMREYLLKLEILRRMLKRYHTKPEIENDKVVYYLDYEGNLLAMHEDTRAKLNALVIRYSRLMCMYTGI